MPGGVVIAFIAFDCLASQETVHIFKQNNTKSLQIDQWALRWAVVWSYRLQLQLLWKRDINEDELS